MTQLSTRIRRGQAVALIGMLLMSACAPVAPTGTETEAAATPTTTLESAPTRAHTPLPTTAEPPAPTAAPDTPMPAPIERLLFIESAEEDPPKDYITLINSDGSNAERLLLFPPPEPGSLPYGYQSYDVVDPVISPNGQFLSVSTLLFLGPPAGSQNRRFIVDLYAKTVMAEYPFDYSRLPSWAPDNRQIVYSLNELLQIYDVSSKELRTLPPSRPSVMPSWSPDGRYIAYLKPLPEGLAELHVIEPDGSNDRTIATSVFVQPEDPFENFEALLNVLTWSPDSQWIAFLTSASPSAPPDIAIVNVDTGEMRVLAASPAKDVNPDWSPDRQRIAFASNRNGQDEIFVVGVDGSSLTSLTPKAEFDHFGPVWSPSGYHIAFITRKQSTGQELQVMNSDGSNMVTISVLDTHAMRPVWLPPVAR